MSLGTGALKVSGGLMQSRHSREVTMATLEAGTTLHAAAKKGTVTLKYIFSGIITYLTILTQTRARQKRGREGLGARISDDSLAPKPFRVIRNNQL